MNTKTFYLASEVDISWSTVKDKLQGLEFTLTKFLEELRAKLYPTIVKHQKEKELMELRRSANMSVM